jgi:hypothetical protein
MVLGNAILQQNGNDFLEADALTEAAPSTLEPFALCCLSVVSITSFDPDFDLRFFHGANFSFKN